MRSEDSVHHLPDLDVRTLEDLAADPRSVPASVIRDYRAVQAWAGAYKDRPVAVVCQHGLKLSQGAAA